MTWTRINGHLVKVKPHTVRCHCGTHVEVSENGDTIEHLAPNGSACEPSKTAPQDRTRSVCHCGLYFCEHRS